MENKKTLCKYCRNSKVIEDSFHSYTYWLEYDCQYKLYDCQYESKEYEHMPDKFECDNYLKMNIIEKIIRYIKVFWFYKLLEVILLIMFLIIIMIFMIKFF